jgi:hypothetical protein
MASLLTVPLELLVQVSSLLSTPDLGALRLTSKQIEKSLYEWFSKEFFTKKQFMLTHKSLQAFVDISKHVSFSKKLSHVIIATNVYQDNCPPFRDNDAAASYIQGYKDQKVLLNTGVDREMLTEAFKNLENLQTVGIRDFNSNNRSRDGIDWSSWGATSVFRETGVELQFAGTSPFNPQIAHEYLARVFQTLVCALGKARRNPEDIEILLRRHSIPDSALNVPEFLLPTVKPVLYNLKKLLLNVDVFFVHKYSQMNGDLLEQGPGRTLLQFLAYTSNLTTLRLNLPKNQIEFNEQLLQRLSAPVSGPGSQASPNYFEPPPVDLPYLTVLELGQFQARPNIILDIVAKFAPTLRDLSLWRMAMIEAPTAYNPKPNVWANLFANIMKVPGIQLHRLKVGMLSQGYNHVQFKSSSSEDAPIVKVKEYTGQKMDAFIKELEDEVFVVWPQIVQVNLEDGEDDDEDEDDEMVDDDDDENEDGEEEDDEDDG